jgi:hypothetical protein
VSTSRKLAPAGFELVSGAAAEVEIADRWDAIRTPVYLHVDSHDLPIVTSPFESLHAFKIKRLQNASSARLQAVGKSRQAMPCGVGKDCRVA